MYFAFAADSISWIFFSLITFMWIAVGIFSSKYSEHMDHKKRFYLFYGLTYIMLAALCFAATYITMYLCFEFMTILSMPLVLHDETKEAIDAAKKYLYYSIFGASLALLGLFFAVNYASIIFTPGGLMVSGLEGKQLFALQIGIFLSVLGFAAKAGMFPLHAWLPTAHPVAPAPASAVLSGVITKAGVLCIIRVIYYVFGTEYIKGTWVQYAWIGLALLTVLLGSLMAYQQKLLKKRFAYSTVSQISYILFGIFTMNAISLTGSLLHVVYHSIIKDCLFLFAGAIIFTNNKADVDELEGLGRKMPISFACFTVAALGLIGIPPFAGFLSKWYLAIGSLEENLVIFNWLGPAILLISALLTAAYLLPISIKGYFPSRAEGKKPEDYAQQCTEAPKQMLISLIALAVLVIVLGIFAQPCVELINNAVGGLF